MNEKIYFEFILRNGFGKCYKETFELIIYHFSKEGAIREGSYIIHCNIGNYNITEMKQKSYFKLLKVLSDFFV